MVSPTNSPLDVVKGREQEIGPAFGVFIIVILLIAGAIYFWMDQFGRGQKNPYATTTEVIIYRKVATSTEKNVSSTSNAELNSMENNLESQTQGVNNLNF